MHIMFLRPALSQRPDLGLFRVILCVNEGGYFMSSKLMVVDANQTHGTKSVRANVCISKVQGLTRHLEVIHQKKTYLYAFHLEHFRFSL